MGVLRSDILKGPRPVAMAPRTRKKKKNLKRRQTRRLPYWERSSMEDLTDAHPASTKPTHTASPSCLFEESFGHLGVWSSILTRQNLKEKNFTGRCTNLLPIHRVCSADTMAKLLRHGEAKDTPERAVETSEGRASERVASLVVHGSPNQRARIRSSGKHHL